MGPLIQAALCFQQLSGFILVGILPQFLPEGEGIVGNFHRICFVSLDFTQRIITEIVNEYGVDNTDEKPGLFQGQGDGPPVHSSVFHDDPDVSIYLTQCLDQAGQPSSIVVYLEWH